MPKKIVLLGATGGCVDVLDTICDINSYAPERRYECVVFLDDKAELHGKRVLGILVLGPFEMVLDYRDDCFFVTGIGSELNYFKRKEIIDSLGIPTDRFESLVHQTASVSQFATLGRGCVIHQNVTITRDVTLGDNVLVLPGSVISHGSTVGSYTIINAGVCIAGDVQIEESCYIWANSAIRQNVVVNAHGLVGMGAVVLKDVPPASIVVGSPAKVLERTRPAT